VKSNVQDKQQVWPDICYKNGSKAMEWLTQVFGFRKHMEVPGPDGEIGHAELSLGNGMIMFASGGKPGDDNPWTTERGGVYAVVDDIDAHSQRAKRPAPRSSGRWPTQATARGNIASAIRKGIAGRSGPIVRELVLISSARTGRRRYPVGAGIIQMKITAYPSGLPCLTTYNITGEAQFFCADWLPSSAARRYHFAASLVSGSIPTTATVFRNFSS